MFTKVALGAFASSALFFALALDARVQAPDARTSPGFAQAKRGAPASRSAIGERCVDCHAAIVASYRKTGMANALNPVQSGEVRGLAPVADGPSGFHYRFEADGSTASIVEQWKGPKGETTVCVRAELAFTIGAGLLDRSFAAAVGDVLWFAPLEVLTAHGGVARHAALAPGHAMQSGTRFTIPIAEECLSCHTDTLPPRDYPLNLRPERSAWQPAGISCDACHGDGDAHVRWREAELAGARHDSTDPIVTGRFTSAIESVSSCARCHLQGDARLALRAGERGVARVGGDLLEQRAIYVAKHPNDDVGFVSQVERLVRSSCFVESAKAGREALTCVTCHDPHASSFEPVERARVRAACTQCHAETAASGAHGCSLPLEKRGAQDCVSCHMRKTPVFDLGEVEIHDHFIRREDPPPSRFEKLRVKEAQDGELALFTWPGKPAASYAGDAGLWMMAYMGLGRPDRAWSYAAREPGAVARALPMYHHLRGSLLESQGKLEEARAAYAAALALDPEQAESAVNLGALFYKLKRYAEGETLLDRVIEKHPQAYSAMRNRALIRKARGDESGFVRDLETAHRISPSGPVARALAQHFEKLGRLEDAARWYADARRLEPQLR
ncbi:MAG: tetratricopeptide repeat protein [Planctomycetota bacterium]